MSHILLRDLDVEDIWKLNKYIENGGYEGLKKAVQMAPQAVIDEVKASGLRGRGGAGFPTGVKWSFIPQDNPLNYVAVNADESEPGTFKDRQILEKNPHQLIEGALICAYAIRARKIYIYCRGEFWDLTQRLDERIEEARAAGFIGENILDSGWDCEVYTHLGAGAYICGEESAMLNSLQGLLGQPRVRPPFPAQKGGGLYYEPTVVNNVETLANVPYILVNGSDAYRQFGTEDSPGVKIFCVSGHAKNPGNYELPLGVTFRELIYEHAGGIRDEKALKGILTAGASAPVLPATDEVLDTPLTYEDVQKVGSSLGSASIILLDETVDMTWAALKMVRFFKHESCGKCTPCREGCYWMLQILERLHRGESAPEDVVLLDEVAAQMAGKCLCALGDFALNPARGTIEHFRADYESHTQGEDVDESAIDQTMPSEQMPYGVREV